LKNIQNILLVDKTCAFIVGLYAWLTSISFGLVLMDIVYAGLVPEAAETFREAADFQLHVNSIMIIAGLGSIWLSWNSSTARKFLLLSLGVIILGFFVYMFLSPFLEENSSTGATIRIVLYGFVSVLAFMGFYKISSVGRD